MSYVTMNRARVLKCNKTGQVAILPAPGEPIIPVNPASGGVSSWNDLTDKPFETTRKVVLDKTVNFEYDEEYSTYFAQIEALPLEANVQYSIEWDGVLYKCTAIGSNNSVGLGNLTLYDDGVGTGEPFIIVVEESVTYIQTMQTGTSHTIKIEAIVTKHIDYEFLPEALQFGYNPEYLNKLTFDGNTSNKHSITDGYDTYYKVSDLTIPNPEGSYPIVFTTGGQSSEREAEIWKSGSQEYYRIDFSNQLMGVMFTQPTKFYDVIGEMGIYICCRGVSEDGQASSYISEISFDKVAYTYKALDAEYLPKASSVADITDAPTAENFNALLKSLRDAGYLAE